MKLWQIACILLAVVVVVLVVVLLLGNRSTRYTVDYSGSKFLFRNARDSYAAGEEVVVYFDLIATDTDYAFSLDGEYLPVTYDDSYGFKICFVMPAHDVTLSVESRNTMLPPEAEPAE